MPTSKKRVKKPEAQVERAVRNPLKTTLGKVVIIVLSFGFVLGVVSALVLVLVQIANR
jgi:hypothetical protein